MKVALPKPVPDTSRQFVIGVESPAEAPVFEPIGSKVAVIGEPLSFLIRAADLDQDPLSFGFVGDFPDGATLTPMVQYGVVRFDWLPNLSDVGLHTVALRVADNGNGGVAPSAVSMIYRLRHSGAYHELGPILLPVGDLTVAEAGELNVQLSAIDPDGDSVMFAATNLPAGARLDPFTGVLTYTPNLFASGQYGNILLTTASDRKRK